MTKRKTVQDCRDLAKSRGGKFLSKLYVSAHVKYEWECDRCSNMWVSSYANVNAGSWCPKCSGTKKKIIKDCHDLAKLRGGKFLSKKYINAHTKYLWECNKCGCRWTAKFNNIQQGKWCPICGGTSRVTIDRCHEVAKKMGGKCLSSTSLSQAHLRWRCGSCTNEWCAVFNNINQGKWCPSCGDLKAARKQRLTQIIKHWKTKEELACIASYEIAVVNYMNLNKIDYQWQSKTFATTILTPTGKVATYRPDLYLIGENKWIEIKGYFRDDARKKWDWFHKEHPNSELWNQEKLKELGIL